jgi:hypothetical protein
MSATGWADSTPFARFKPVEHFAQVIDVRISRRHTPSSSSSSGWRSVRSIEDHDPLASNLAADRQIVYITVIYNYHS